VARVFWLMPEFSCPPDWDNVVNRWNRCDIEQPSTREGVRVVADISAVVSLDYYDAGIVVDRGGANWNASKNLAYYARMPERVPTLAPVTAATSTRRPNSGLSSYAPLMMVRTRRVKKLKRPRRQSVIHGQYSAAGGRPVDFWGDR
jgi:hypothetical protein